MTAADFQANRAIQIVPSKIANAVVTGEVEACCGIAASLSAPARQ
jgi:hypothetical protein